MRSILQRAVLAVVLSARLAGSVWAQAEPNNAAGVAAYNAGRYEEALGHFSRHFNLHPGCSVALANQGRCYYRLKNYSLAVARFSQALRNNQYSDVIGDATESRMEDYGWRAKAYYYAGNYKAAASDFTQALRHFPRELEYVYPRGRCYLLTDRPSEAVADFNRALQLGHADVAGLMSERGIAYLRLKQYDRALEHFTQVIRQQPASGAAYRWRIAALLAAGDGQRAGDEAALDIDRSSRLDADSQHMAVYGYLGYLLVGQAEAAQQLVVAAAENSSSTEWPHPILEYLRDELTARALFDLALDSAKMTEVQAIVALQAVMKGDVAAGHERLKWVASTGTREGIAVDLARCELRDRTFSRFAPAQAAKRDEATSAAEQGPISRTAAYPPSSIAGYRAPRQRPYAGQSLNSIDVPKVEESELGSELDALPDVDDVLKAFETDLQKADEKQIEAK